MDPVALEKAFEIYPDVKLIVVAHLYGTPGKIDEIRTIAKSHGALIVEDAAESLGAKYYSTLDNPEGQWIETGALGDYNCISFIVNNKPTGKNTKKTVRYGKNICQNSQIHNGCLAA